MSKRNILISVIGKPSAGEYKSVKYEIEKGVIKESNFFFIPILKKYRIEKLFLLGTRDSIWSKIPENIEYEKVIIPLGKIEEDQWGIFNIINELSINNSNLYFDFTHGFRTMPFISLLSIVYFKATMPNVKIRKVLYGNYEGRNPETNICPVIDLSGFLDIFDWLYAAKSFTEFGNGEVLCNLLRKYPDKNISKLRESISDINSAMQLAYMTELPLQFEKMTQAIKKIDLSTLPTISPLKTIMPEIKKLTTLINYTAREYEKQMTIAKWYYDNNQVAIAVITLRETYITFIGEMGGFAISEYSERTQIADVILNDFKLLKRNQLYKLIDLWKKIRDVRNAVGHPVFDKVKDEDIRDKKRIGDWIGESRKLFEELNKSENFKKFMKKIQSENILKVKKTYSIDDLKRKFNNK